MRYSAVTPGPVLLLIAALGCGNKDAGADSDAGFFANASGEAKEALSAPVSFELNENNFAKWEIAERNLDDVPSSEFSRAQQAGGSVTDRAVARLESSPRAKRAIEAAGLSVRDFVLETVALAQAVQASRTGGSSSGVAAANFAFVERYRERIRGSGLESDLARQSGDAAITDANTAAELEAANADRIADSIAGSNQNDTLESGGVARLLRPQRDSARDSLRDTLSRQR